MAGVWETFEGNLDPAGVHNYPSLLVKTFYFSALPVPVESSRTIRHIHKRTLVSEMCLTINTHIEGFVKSQLLHCQLSLCESECSRLLHQ